MKRALMLVLCGLVASSPAAADYDGCNDAMDAYNAAVSEIDLATRRYSSCVASSRGENDCSGEFARIRVAQDSFARAVDDIADECAPG